MINNPDKDRKKYNCFLKRSIFGIKQSLFIMTFTISNFFQNNTLTRYDLYRNIATKQSNLLDLEDNEQFVWLLSQEDTDCIQWLSIY